MAERRQIQLDDNDVVAAAQILSWIALPHRPQDGVDLLCNWYWGRRRHRRELVPPLPFRLKKPGVITPQLRTFRGYVLQGFRAGTWFEQVALSGPNRPPMFAGIDVSVRSLARMQLPGDRRGGEPEAEGNPIKKIWSRRKPVAHLAIAAASAIADEHDRVGAEGFDLEMTVFNPIWVGAALEQAESRARGAVRTGAFEARQLYHFKRDTF